MIYIIQANDRVKIGFSDSPAQRLEALQSCSPYPLYPLLVIEGNLSIEADLHHRFSGHRVYGEWFMYHDVIRQFVEDNADNDLRYELGLGENTETQDGWILRRARQRYGISGKELGTRTGVTRDAISQAELHERSGRITLRVMRRMAKAMEMVLQYRLVPAPTCESCAGTGWYGSGFIKRKCSACCTHPDGWAELTDGYAGYKKGADNRCCKTGCGTMARDIVRSRQR